jgi:hypothetical protein
MKRLLSWIVMNKPYLISIASWTPGVDDYVRSLLMLGDSVEWINVELEIYPGHLYRWDYIPKGLDRNRLFIFTDTADVIFQAPLPELDPKFIYVSDEGIKFKDNGFWMGVIERNPRFKSLKENQIYNVGTWAALGHIMDDWVEFVKKERGKTKNMVIEQLLFNVWLQDKEITVHPNLFGTLYSSYSKGIIKLDHGIFYDNEHGIISIIHGNGDSKSLLKTNS